MQYDASQASRRFGFGWRPTESVPADVRGWLAGQLDATDPLLSGPGPSTSYGLVVAKPTAEEAKTFPRPHYGMADLFWDEMEAYLRHATTTGSPVRERLVWFWTNHFSISGRAGN